jgi:hypothetical protein
MNISLIYILIVFSFCKEHYSTTKSNEIHHIIKRYISIHGNIDLENQKYLWNRKYIIGRYLCPHSIGNRIHEFLNSFAISIITNRTFLWEYKYKWMNEKDCAKVMHNY